MNYPEVFICDNSVKINCRRKQCRWNKDLTCSNITIKINENGHCWSLKDDFWIHGIPKKESKRKRTTTYLQRLFKPWLRNMVSRRNLSKKQNTTIQMQHMRTQRRKKPIENFINNIHTIIRHGTSRRSRLSCISSVWNNRNIHHNPIYSTVSKRRCSSSSSNRTIRYISCICSYSCFFVK